MVAGREDHGWQGVLADPAGCDGGWIYRRRRAIENVGVHIASRVTKYTLKRALDLSPHSGCDARNPNNGGVFQHIRGQVEYTPQLHPHSV